MFGHDRPTAFYDGACPLCAREIGFYRRQEGADWICWVDISSIDTMDVAPDLAREEALARFTVRDADGSLVSGGRAFTLGHLEEWACQRPAVHGTGRFVGSARLGQRHQRLFAS
jgi:predicted DCC family thiol-disulfide oxidoreductase YuxK